MSRCRILMIFQILLYGVLIAPVASADTEGPSYPYVTTALQGRYYFKMIPDDQDLDDRERGSGICYQVTLNNEDKILWRSKGWYSFKVYLSDDGQFLVRMGNWPRGHELSDDDLAIAFYKEGTLLKKYSTKDIVKDPSAIQRTVSHYFWLESAPVFSSYDNQLRLITKDKTEYIFSIIDGEIKSQRKIK